MKVAFVLGTSTGGTARHVRTLAAGCAARGVAAGVFGPEQTDRDFGFSRLAGGQVSFTPVDIADRPRVARDLRAIRRLRRLLAAWRPDVAHAHGLRAGALTAIALAFVRPTVYHPRPALVVTVHNAPPAGGATGAVYRVLERIVAGRADSVLCVSPDLEERMRAAGARRVGRALVPAASGGVSAETPRRVRCQVTRTRIAPLVLAAGRLAAQKGFGTLLEAAAGWRDLRPEPLLVIAGEGPLDGRPEEPGGPPRARRPVRRAPRRHTRPAGRGRGVRPAQHLGRPAAHPAGSPARRGAHRGHPGRRHARAHRRGRRRTRPAR